MKKLFCIALAVLMLLSSVSVMAGAVKIEDGLDALKAQFTAGEGPKAGEYSVDYRYYSPVKGSESKKYPLVIWLHGMGDGSEEGAQVAKSEIAYWASEEFQARFEPAGGAFIFAPRSREENSVFWGDKMLEPLMAAVNDFISKNSANIDVTRIYMGGYSMGGKMTLETAVAFPEMFAAIFPICPAWVPDESTAALIADIPVWITSSTRDPLVNYHFAVTPAWNNIVKTNERLEDCRFSTLTKVCYANGKKTPSSHHAWFAVNYDMFTVDNGAYHYMNTVNGAGEEVTLSYPDGMISWLSQFTSDYDGTPCTGMGNINGEIDTGTLFTFEPVWDFFRSIFDKIFSAFGLDIFKVKK
ncbi:MAG: hypothetical protein IJC37_04240 [Clostridia bacterium]|nr:hypothetical protein [Clostridia bacterium]